MKREDKLFFQPRRDDGTLLPVTLKAAQARHARLTDELRRHDHAYYVLGQPELTDYEYDRLYQELLDLEKDFPTLVTAESPSQRVGGAPAEGFTRVKHLQPMLSLEKVEAADHPTKDEEPDRDQRNRLQRLLERLIGVGGGLPTCRRQSGGQRGLRARPRASELGKPNSTYSTFCTARWYETFKMYL